MDAVITYCNGEDKNFQSLYSEYKKDVASKSNRWRDLGTLKYVLRGIDKYMPFIDNVFLVVNMESQIPNWLNRNNVHIVYHDQIIPKEFLPVFNSTAIEMFFHKIPGLSNEFIYFNDDTIPWNYMTKEDFIKDGKIRVRLYNRKFNQNNKDINYNCLYNSCKLNNIGDNIEDFYSVEHHPYAFFKDKMEECYNKNESKILDSVSRFRETKNLNQSVYLFYNLYENRVLQRDDEIGTYVEFGYKNVLKLIIRCKKKMLCINDAGKFTNRITDCVNILLKRKMPIKSKFEK